MADRTRTELAVEVLTRACWRKKLGLGFILLSNRGSQYTSAAYRKTFSVAHKEMPQSNNYAKRGGKGSLY